MKKSKIGVVALEFVVAISLLVPVLLIYISGGYTYYMAQSQNVSLNYDAGRYFSTMSACDKGQIFAFQLNSKYSHYDIEAIINGRSAIKSAVGEKEGTVTVTCSTANWSPGTNFGVNTVKDFDSIATHFPFFPKAAYKGGRYVVE